MINYFQKNTQLSYFIKFSAWLLIFLMILEIFTRSFILKLPYQHYVSGLGTVPVNNAVTIWGVEGYGVTHYFSNGEIFTPYQSGISVVVLGDSYTEALQVSDNQKYVSIAENTLHERGVNMDLHNLGASGRSLADYVYIAPFIIKTYSPDIVVVQLSGNDFDESLDMTRENYFERSGISLKLAHNEDYFLADQNIRNMVRISGLVSLARNKLSPIINEQRRRLATAGQTEAELPPVIFNELEPYEIEMQVNALKEAYPNAEFVFLVIPRVPDVQGADLVLNNEDDDFIVKALSEFCGPSLLYPRNVFIDLYSAYRKFPRGFNNTLPNTGHLNSNGNFVLGVALADYLEDIAK